MIDNIQVKHSATVELSTKDHSFIEIECEITETIAGSWKTEYPFCVTSFKISHMPSLSIPVNIQSNQSTLLDAIKSFEKNYSEIINKLLNEFQAKKPLSFKDRGIKRA